MLGQRVRGGFKPFVHVRVVEPIALKLKWFAGGGSGEILKTSGGLAVGELCREAVLSDGSKTVRPKSWIDGDQAVRDWSYCDAWRLGQVQA